MEHPRDIFRDDSYRFHPALVLDATIPRKFRTTVSVILGLLFAVSLIGAAILVMVSSSAPTAIPSLSGVIAMITHGLLMGPGFAHQAFGLALILLGCWLPVLALGWFSNSYYFYVEALLERGESGTKTPYTTPNYETNELYFHTSEGDLLSAFLLSSYGSRIALRSGIAPELLSPFLSSRTIAVDFRQYPEIASVFTLRDVVSAIITFDRAFADFVFARGVRPEDLLASAEWVEKELKARRQSLRWWGRVALGRSHGIGSELSYGIAYDLERYGTDLTALVSSGDLSFRNLYGSDSIAKIEAILTRGKDPNVLLVGEEGGSMMDVVVDFAHDVANGHSRSELTPKKIISLDWKRILSGARSKQDLELLLMKTLAGAVHAGNVIIVIDDFPGFLVNARQIGSDMVSFLDEYAVSDRIQFILTSDVGRYHSLLEQSGAFRERFETILIPEPEASAMVRSLEDIAEGLERRWHLLFTFPAIRAIKEGIARYFVDATMPQKAIDLMGELAPAVASRGEHVVTYEHVMNFIQAKTNIPVGTITDDERARLENLEHLLQMHVVGQSKALQVIANALRRSRAGVRNPDRPIGTFLFLGPTGVGKTETAKALARVFFGDESSMSRLDMSEFQAEDGLERLIGGSGRAGILANMLRERPYGVLLLDEFEKTHPKVLDLFLQVFDEGAFHDANGKRVNARNTIIIATSNAGAKVIRDAMHEGRDLNTIEQEVIDAVISEGKYKPELLNRFDGIVIFHPLTREDYRQVALLLVEKLKKRMREQNVDIAVNDVLIEALLAKGVDPDFGARPMNRAVQEIVEQKVAEKIIKGEVRPGMTVTFSERDFPDVFAQQQGADVGIPLDIPSQQ